MDWLWFAVAIFFWSWYSSLPAVVVAGWVGYRNARPTLMTFFSLCAIVWAAWFVVLIAAEREYPSGQIILMYGQYAAIFVLIAYVIGWSTGYVLSPANQQGRVNTK